MLVGGLAHLGSGQFGARRKPDDQRSTACRRRASPTSTSGNTGHGERSYDQRERDHLAPTAPSSFATAMKKASPDQTTGDPCATSRRSNALPPSSPPEARESGSESEENSRAEHRDGGQRKARSKGGRNNRHLNCHGETERHQVCAPPDDVARVARCRRRACPASRSRGRTRRTLRRPSARGQPMASRRRCGVSSDPARVRGARGVLRAPRVRFDLACLYLVFAVRRGFARFVLSPVPGDLLTDRLSNLHDNWQHHRPALCFIEPISL